MATKHLLIEFLTNRFGDDSFTSSGSSGLSKLSLSGSSEAGELAPGENAGSSTFTSMLSS